MREKNIKEAIKEMQDKYVITPLELFELNAIFELEDEYLKLVKANPEHTKRRQELLLMRNRLKQGFRYIPKKDVYIDFGDECVTVYYDNHILCIKERNEEKVFNILNYHKLLENTLIHIKAPGVCDELSSSFIRYFQNYSISHDFLEELTTE